MNPAFIFSGYEGLISGLMNQPERIYLSPPHLDGDEIELVKEALDSNWIAPAGPQIEEFEKELAAYHQVQHAIALNSGTAALHLALILAGIKPGDLVLCSTFTFIASANPIKYLGAQPVFIDAESESWGMCPSALQNALESYQHIGIKPKAVIVANVYGQPANLPRIKELCEHWDVILIEDNAEALGAELGNRPSGAFGIFSVLSFNGNKLVTSSGGGALLINDSEHAEKALLLATQAKEPGLGYTHRHLGFNYRISNILAALGRAQFAKLKHRIMLRRDLFSQYQQQLSDLPIKFMPEPSWARSTRWLTCLTLSPDCRVSPQEICEGMEQENIECRPAWKPLHRQPLYRDAEYFGGMVAEDLFHRGLCLPSGSDMAEAERNRVVTTFRSLIH